MKSNFTISLFLALALFANATFAQDEITSTELVPTQVLQPVRVQETTAEFSRVAAHVEAFVEKHGAKKVLLVVDLDNTLLAMNQDLGSDQWFNWQEELQEADENHPDLVAPTFPELLEAQGILFALSSMHPPQPDLPQIINGLSDSGVTTFVLTSRGKEFRNSSERELKRNGYRFMKSSLTINEKRGVFQPYDRLRPQAHGLDAQITRELGDPRSVTYADGLFMTAGQHKGHMLRTLLARTESEDLLGGFSAIVFVDDREKHTKRMQEAFAGLPVDLATFRYSREDGNVSKFEKSTKDHVIRDWKMLSAFTKTVLVK